MSVHLTRLQHLSELQIQETDPQIYIKKLLANDKKMYEGIKMMLKVQAVAAGSISLEGYDGHEQSFFFNLINISLNLV